MKTIMTAGKGGTGKTTILFELLTRRFFPDNADGQLGRVLVVDADPHQCLSELLAGEYQLTRRAPALGDLRREHQPALQYGTNLETASRCELADLLTRYALTPLPQGDLLTMGANDQHGCQCVVNHLLGRALDSLAEQYELVIVDNEAGIEPIGRHAWEVDLLLLSASRRPLDAEVALRILRHASTVNRTIQRALLLLNFEAADAGEYAGNVELLRQVEEVIRLPAQQAREDWQAGIENLYGSLRAALGIALPGRV